MTPEQAETITLFRQKVADMRRRSFFEGSDKIVLQLDPEAPTGLRGVSEDELRALLALLRQFILEKEPSNLLRVIKLIRSECSRSELCQWARYVKSGWTRTLRSRPLGGEPDGYTVSDAIDLLLNTQVVHADRLKSRRLRQEDTITQGFLRQIVIVSLPRLCHGPVLIDLVLKHWLDVPTEPVPPCPEAGNP